MNLKIMTAESVDAHIKTLFKKECELIHEVLLTLQEISRRRIYQDLGYASLYTYLTQEVGYSEGTAQRHIQAARLLSSVPEIGEKIQSGEISLAQMNIVQKAVSEINSRSEAPVTSEKKSEILLQIANSTTFESEKQGGFL